MVTNPSNAEPSSQSAGGSGTAARVTVISGELTFPPLAKPFSIVAVLPVPGETAVTWIEIWFGILVKKVIRRGNFRSKNALKDKILAFADYFNKTMVTPFETGCSPQLNHCIPALPE